MVNCHRTTIGATASLTPFRSVSYDHRECYINHSKQEEYLHQTYNSMPDMTQKLNMIIMDPNIQWNIYNDSRAEVTRNKPTTPNITKVYLSK